jgi:predicted site-specific integrase-resolvase
VALKKDKVFGKDYVFDIMGNWSMGDIVVMKRTSMQKSDYEKQIDRYQKVVDKKIKKISKIFF